MDTLSELASNSGGRPPYLTRASTGGRSTKSFKTRGINGGASKSERRLLMEAKAGVGAAIAEVRFFGLCAFFADRLVLFLSKGADRDSYRKNPQRRLPLSLFSPGSTGGRVFATEHLTLPDTTKLATGRL